MGGMAWGELMKELERAQEEIRSDGQRGVSRQSSVWDREGSWRCSHPSCIAPQGSVTACGLSCTTKLSKGKPSDRRVDPVLPSLASGAASRPTHVRIRL